MSSALVDDVTSIEIALSTPCSSCLQSDTPPNSPRLHSPRDAEIVERIEQAVQKLVQALKRDTKNKCEDAKLEATKKVEAEKSKIRVSKLEHKQVDEVYVTFFKATTLLTLLLTVGILVYPIIKS